MDTAPEVRARTVAGMLRDGRYAEVVDLFAPPLRAVVSEEKLRLAWTGELEKTGPVTEVGEPVAEQGGGGMARLRVPVTCANGGLAVVLTIDDTGMLQGIWLAPLESTSWTRPSYAAPRRFAEQEVVVGSGALAVPGTLTVPRGRGPRPGVVLLSGGGPFDRDQTSGVNKPLKDLAWGLASRGIAVVRFEKVTYTHGHAAAAPDFTMEREYVPHAVAAVRLLAEQSTVDAERVFVLGHSMGGKVAPRVAAAEPAVAGMVILAGDTQPMHHAAVRVVRYLASVVPQAFDEAAVELITRQAALVGSPELSSATPAADLPFGFSGSYWLDLRDYDPVATAAALDKPMLILQGGRDYQVTVEDDLVRWRTALAHRPDITIRVYPADDHLFFPGAGPSTPADYEAPHHVDPAVVADVARWLAPDQGWLGRLRTGRRSRS